MRYLTCVILIIVSNLTYGQLVSVDFNHVVLFDDFTANVNNWNERTSEKEYFRIQDEKYTLKRLSDVFFSVSMPQEHNDYSTYKVSAKIKVEEDKENNKASGGLMFMGQRSGIGAYALEMNARQQFRLLILQNGSLHPLYPERDQGWVYTKDIKKGKSNLVEIRSANGSFDLFINGQYQQSFISDTYPSGAIGFYVNAKSTLEVDFIKIEARSDGIVSENPEEVDPEDIEDETYSQLILIFKTKIDDQQKEIDRIKRELSVCKSSLNIDTTARKQNTDLRRENNELKIRLQKVETSLTKAQTRLEYLESMKKDIENSQNGDLILGLTDLLSKEKKKNDELSKKIATLEGEIKSLKN